MDIRTKTAIITAITLILGIALGALISPLSKDSQHRKRASHDFFGYLEKIIQPEATQKESLDALFQVYEKRLDKLSGQYRANIRVTIDSLYVELRGILTAEQNARVQQKRQEWLKRHQKQEASGDAGKDKEGG